MQFHFEYVMSGLGFTRLKEHGPIDFVANKYRTDFEQSSFSVLYNAFTEKDYGKRFSLADTNIYADSGGLQMVTRNLGITDKLKDDIYENQAQCSTYAMCFDEIPMVKVQDSGKIGSQQGRYYDRSLIQAKATETARNIKRQLEVFDRLESTARPVAIIQGNCADTMLEWSDVLFSTLGDDVKRVGSVAISGVCIGNKTMEEIERSFVFSEVNRVYGINHLHLLGVGSISRIAPFLIFDKRFKKDITISYDSTSHTQATTFGYHFWEDNLEKLKKGLTHEWDEMAERLFRFTGGAIHLDGPRLHHICYKSIKGLPKEESDEVRYTLFMMAAMQAYQLSRYVENTCKTFEESLFHHDEHLWLPLKLLNEEVDSVKDFQKWSGEFSRHIPTSRVNSSNNNLEALFG